MAFGFGFNKQKVLSAAEKCVQQGKLPNAISEYEKVLKADPKDLTVMNTVGDLHSRLGATDQAAECFKSVGDAYASQGFTVKAIAMYKKLSKLKTSTECTLRKLRRTGDERGNSGEPGTERGNSEAPQAKGTSRRFKRGGRRGPGVE